jgi:hypothetical protein
LVVAPDDAEIGPEFIEYSARPTKAFDHVAPMQVGMRLAFILSPLPSHGLRPIFHRTQALWQRRIRQAYFDATG